MKPLQDIALACKQRENYSNWGRTCWMWLSMLGIKIIIQISKLTEKQLKFMNLLIKFCIHSFRLS